MLSARVDRCPSPEGKLGRNPVFPVDAFRVRAPGLNRRGRVNTQLMNINAGEGGGGEGEWNTAFSRVNEALVTERALLLGHSVYRISRVKSFFLLSI